MSVLKLFATVYMVLFLFKELTASNSPIGIANLFDASIFLFFGMKIPTTLRSRQLTALDIEIKQ